MYEYDIIQNIPIETFSMAKKLSHKILSADTTIIKQKLYAELGDNILLNNAFISRKFYQRLKNE